MGELLQTCGHFPLLTAPHLSGAPRAQHSTPARVLEGQSRVGETPFLTGWPCSFWCSLGCDWLPVLKAHITSSFLIHQYPQVLHRAVFNPFMPQSVLMFGISPTQVQDFALGSVEPLSLWMALLKEPTCAPSPSTTLSALPHESNTGWIYYPNNPEETTESMHLFLKCYLLRKWF